MSDPLVTISIADSSREGVEEIVMSPALARHAKELLAAARSIAAFALAWEPLTPGDIRELTTAIRKCEGREP
jgi:hypothetical protein